MVRILLILLIIVLSSASTATAVQVAPRITDRGIIEALAVIRGDINNLQGDLQGLREEVKEVKGDLQGLREEVKGDIQGLREEVQRLEGRLDWGFGLLFSGMLILMGFVLWDRRTTLAPLVKEMKEKDSEIAELKKQVKEAILLKDILRGYAKEEPKLAGLMRAEGLL
ncbi:MAG: hypothetical protein AB1797_08800 [bacterium]